MCGRQCRRKKFFKSTTHATIKERPVTTANTLTTPILSVLVNFITTFIKKLKRRILYNYNRKTPRGCHPCTKGELRSKDKRIIPSSYHREICKINTIEVQKLKLKSSYTKPSKIGAWNLEKWKLNPKKICWFLSSKCATILPTLWQDKLFLSLFRQQEYLQQNKVGRRSTLNKGKYKCQRKITQG